MNRSAETTANPFLPCESCHLSLAIVFTSAPLQHVAPSPVHSAPVSHYIDLSVMAPVSKMNIAWPPASIKPNSFSLCLDLSFLGISRCWTWSICNIYDVTWRPISRQSWVLIYCNDYPIKCSMLRKGQRFHDSCGGLSFKICFLFQEECFLRRLSVTCLFMLAKWKSHGTSPFLLWQAT